MIAPRNCPGALPGHLAVGIRLPSLHPRGASNRRFAYCGERVRATLKDPQSDIHGYGVLGADHNDSDCRVRGHASAHCENGDVWLGTVGSFAWQFALSGSVKDG